MTTTTAAGTSAAASTTTVLDLVTGQTVRVIDGLGRATSYTYDASGRRTSTTTPDGLATTTSYTAAAGATPATRTDTGPDGRIQLTTYDALGRRVRVTDNVHDQAFTGSPTSRQLAAYTYSLDGTKLTATDRSGRTIDTTLDALGRQVSQVGVTGITHGTAYDDAAHTRMQTVTGVGSATAAMTRTSTYDNGNRPVTVQRQYSDGTADPTQTPATTAWAADRADGRRRDPRRQLPRRRRRVHREDRDPQDPAEFPGDPISLSTTHALGGSRPAASAPSPAPARGHQADVRPGRPDAHLDRPQRPYHRRTPTTPTAPSRPAPHRPAR